MNTKFDELTKSMAQSVTRRGALKKFSVGLAGMALAYFGLANKAEAGHCLRSYAPCKKKEHCCTSYCRPDNTCGCLSDSDCAREGSMFCVDGYCAQFV